MASGTSWDVIIGSIASSLAILIFITGRNSLADLVRKKRPVSVTPHQPAAPSGRLTRFLNKPVFLIIGIISSILGIYAFTKDLIGTEHPVFKKEIEKAQQNISATDAAAQKQGTAPETAKTPVNKHTKGNPRLTGIRIYTNNQLPESYVTHRVQAVIEAGQHPLPVIRGTFTIYKIQDASIGNTQTLTYSITLQLKIYRPDGAAVCNNWYDAEYISADDQKPLHVIKEQALTALTNRMKQRLATLLDPCH
jgi:hypothetical protein